jgi:hypothetical protein
MRCCSIVATYSASLASMCTSVAASNNQSSCMGVVATLPAQVQPYCQ